MILPPLPAPKAAAVALPEGDPWVAAFHHACTLQSEGQDADARTAFEGLLQWAPAGHLTRAPAWSNLGLLLEAQGQRHAAREAWLQALQADARCFEAALHLGQWWMREPAADAPAQAEAWLQRAAQLQPTSPSPWSALGGLLMAQHRDADAQACLRQALQCDPEHGGARFNLGTLLLRHGQHEAGWACLESRDALTPLVRQLPWPRWGGEPLAGRRLLLVADAGHGDVLQMWRYRRWLREAHTVDAWVQEALIPLLAVQPDRGADQRLHALGEPWPADAPQPDVWAPIMSLPWLCGLQHPEALSPRGWAQPYLQAPAVPKPLPADRAFTIGLVARGNPRHENDAERSLHQADPWRPLQDAAASAGLPLRWVDLVAGPPWQDFAQVAQALQGLDLLITVDTAYAHLAGALGCPTWVLLPHWLTDWRWGALHDATRDATDWYPGVMRLWRQPRRGDWAAVFAQLSAALPQVVAAQRRAAPPNPAG